MHAALFIAHTPVAIQNLEFGRQAASVTFFSPHAAVKVEREILHTMSSKTPAARNLLQEKVSEPEMRWEPKPTHPLFTGGTLTSGDFVPFQVHFSFYRQIRQWTWAEWIVLSIHSFDAMPSMAAAQWWFNGGSLSIFSILIIVLVTFIVGALWSFHCFNNGVQSLIFACVLRRIFLLVNNVYSIAVNNGFCGFVSESE